MQNMPVKHHIVLVLNTDWKLCHYHVQIISSFEQRGNRNIIWYNKQKNFQLSHVLSLCLHGDKKSNNLDYFDHSSFAIMEKQFLSIFWKKQVLYLLSL